MTRKEYELAMQQVQTVTGALAPMEKYIESLEQRIAELELQLSDANSYFDGVHTELEAPKTCEGCKWDCPRESFIYDEYCSMCIRDNNKEDYYEPKETK